jgi:hypothetical protein
VGVRITKEATQMSIQDLAKAFELHSIDFRVVEDGVYAENRLTFNGILETSWEFFAAGTPRQEVMEWLGY